MTVNRRTFLACSTSCAAHVALLAVGAPRAAAAWSGRGRRCATAREPWGNLERVADGVWALVSTPLEDRTTLCNGGIVAGRTGTMVIESFASPAGARWMAEQARECTGRWPTHVVLTHFHGDHTGGLSAFADAPVPQLLATGATRDLVREADAARGEPVAPERSGLLADVVLLDPAGPTEVDLGGRRVRLVPRDGHTPSDVTVELDDPATVFCGDLVWNRMFPNYRDAIPSHLARAVRALPGTAELYVPGHGPLADADDLARYVALIDHVEDAARRAHDAGIPATEAAQTLRVPEALGEWMLFSDRYFEVALRAWERELRDR